MKALQVKYQELYETRRMIESKLFQKYFAEPLRERMDKKAVCFFAEDLKENWRTGGQVEGINEFFDILREVSNDFKNTKTEIENSQTL